MEQVGQIAARPQPIGLWHQTPAGVRALTLLGFVVVWELIGRTGIFFPDLFPPFVSIIQALWEHVSTPVLLPHLGASMKLSRRQIFRHILIPAAAPTVFSGFRLGLTYILKSVLGLEYIVQVGGIGMWVSDSAYRFEIGEVYAGLLGTILLSIAFLYAINRTEGWVRR